MVRRLLLPKGLADAAEGLGHFIKCINCQNSLISSVNLINAWTNKGMTCFVFT